MRIVLTVLVISSMALSACSGLRESRLNPGNWFGKSHSTAVKQPTPGEVNPLIPESKTIFDRNKVKVYRGTPVDQISSLVVERTAGGAIIRVTGIALRQGAHDVRLTSDTDDTAVDGVLSYTLKAVQPTDTPQGLPTARTITAARFVSSQKLERARTIQVVGARNVQTTRR